MYTSFPKGKLFYYALKCIVKYHVGLTEKNVDSTVEHRHLRQ